MADPNAAKKLFENLHAKSVGQVSNAMIDTEREIKEINDKMIKLAPKIQAAQELLTKKEDIRHAIAPRDMESFNLAVEDAKKVINENRKLQIQLNTLQETISRK